MMMMTMTASRCYGGITAATLVLLLLVSNSHSFAPDARFQSQRRSFAAPSLHTPRNSIVRQVGEDLEADSLMNMKESIVLTPEGTGFSSPISRILKLARRGDGFCRSNGSDRVIDVMEAITKDVEDSALVFDDDTNELVGIFTESDYIRVRTWLVRISCSLTVPSLTLRVLVFHRTCQGNKHIARVG